MEEHRTFYRLTEPFTLEFQPSGASGGGKFVREGMDLSGGGARFESETPMEVGTQLALTIGLSPGQPPIRCEAQVAFCQNTGDEGVFEVGVHFQGMTVEDRDRLLTHIGEKRRAR